MNPHNQGQTQSIFKKYYEQEALDDKFIREPEGAVDVIIPVMHTNELWKSNLTSFYREIPIQNLLIGDGGCIDETIPIVKQFPRVTVFDHRSYTSLGYSIKKLIESVSTEWFVYLHSDVYLPKHWFATMQRNQKKYDWFECPQRLTVMLEIPKHYKTFDRPMSGSQMGKREVFSKILPTIDDDYLYRNEDIVYEHLITEMGYQYGSVPETYHYHQVMNKKSGFRREITDLTFAVDKSPEEKSREYNMQVRGIIKYTKPTPYLIKSVDKCITILTQMKEINWPEFTEWTRQTNAAWLPYLKRYSLKRIIYRFLLRSRFLLKNIN